MGGPMVSATSEPPMDRQRQGTRPNKPKVPVTYMEQTHKTNKLAIWVLKINTNHVIEMSTYFSSIIGFKILNVWELNMIVFEPFVTLT